MAVAVVVSVEVGVNVAVGVGVDVTWAFATDGLVTRQTPRKIINEETVKQKMDRIFLLINKKCKQIFF